MEAIILVGGLGTRLRPLTLKTPKCLVEIDGIPLLRIWLEKLKNLGCDEVLINTHYLNDQVENYLSRFIVHPHREAKFAHVLWILHAQLMNEWETTPRLAFLSPEPGSGKTRALEITALLVPNAVESANQTAAYIARKVSKKVAMHLSPKSFQSISLNIFISLIRHSTLVHSIRHFVPLATNLK